MFPRRDVGMKGSSPVQECPRQPVHAKNRAGELWEMKCCFYRHELYVCIWSSTINATLQTVNELFF